MAKIVSVKRNDIVVAQVVIKKSYIIGKLTYDLRFWDPANKKWWTRFGKPRFDNEASALKDALALLKGFDQTFILRQKDITAKTVPDDRLKLYEKV